MAWTASRLDELGRAFRGTPSQRHHEDELLESIHFIVYLEPLLPITFANPVREIQRQPLDTQIYRLKLLLVQEIPECKVIEDPPRNESISLCHKNVENKRDTVSGSD